MPPIPRRALVAALLAQAAPGWAQEVPVFRLTLQDNRFDPAELRVPSGTRFQLIVRNAGGAVAEFESTDLNVERIIMTGRETRIRLGPLPPGRYEFFDDFGPEARGALIAVEPE